ACQFGRQVLLELLARDDLASRLQQRTDDDAGAAGVHPVADRLDCVPGLAAEHRHLPPAAVRPGRGHPELLGPAPEAEQADAELAVNPLPLPGIEVPLHRVADVRGNVGEIRTPVAVGPHAVAVIVDFEEDLPLELAADDLDPAAAGIDRVLGQLAN